MKKIFLGICMLFLVAGAGCGASAPSDQSVDTTQPSNTTPTPEIPVDNTVPATTSASTPPTTTPDTTKNPTTTAVMYTMDQVASANNTPGKCWTVIRGVVYDLTDWIKKHPGGEKAILGLCGKDGTEKFVNKHGGQTQMENALKGFEIGVLKK